jgi:porin
MNSVRRRPYLGPHRGPRVVSVVAAGIAAVAGMIHAASAQTIDPESDRIPDPVDEPSIATSLPPALADPGGVRSSLGGEGVTFHVNYIGEVLSNPTGGVAQGSFYDGRLELALKADFDTMIGWKGLTFFANAYQIHGQSITANDLGALMPVSFIEALPDTRLFELWFEQKLLSDRLAIRFGQLAADSDFLISEGSQALLNSTWGWPSIAGINIPDGGPSYPIAAPGVRVAFEPDPHVKLMAGLYTGDPAEDCASGIPQKCNPNGLGFPFSDPLLMMEAAYKHHQGEGELAGTVKIGAWRLFSTFEQRSIGTNGLPIALPAIPGEVSDQDYALYAIVDQMLYRVPDSKDHKGISVFASVISAPSAGNMTQSYWEAGLTFSGLWSECRSDIFAVGYANTGVSSEIQQFERATNEPIIPSYEGVIEASYTAQVVPGFYLQPDFQYFWNPGGHVADPGAPTEVLPNALVLGLRTTINY